MKEHALLYVYIILTSDIDILCLILQFVTLWSVLITFWCVL